MKRIIASSDFYMGTFDIPHAGFITNDKNRIREWETDDEAQKWIAKEEKNEEAYLEHGGTVKVTFKIVNISK